MPLGYLLVAQDVGHVLIELSGRNRDAEGRVSPGAGKGEPPGLQQPG